MARPDNKKKVLSSQKRYIVSHTSGELLASKIYY